MTGENLMACSLLLVTMAFVGAFAYAGWLMTHRERE